MLCTNPSEMCLSQCAGEDNTLMKQSSLGLSNTTKRTRKREFLDAMELVVPWAELVSLIEPYAPEIGRRGQCMKWIRSRVCTAKGCWPRRPLSGA